MSTRSRGLSFALVLGLIFVVGRDGNAAMTLDFAITPMVQPMSGSLSEDPSGTIVGTNLAVTSVASVETGQVVTLSKYLDFQSAGTTGANFFILDGFVQQYAGTSPTAMTSPAPSTNLTALTAGGFVFTMQITDGYVSNDLALQFGGIGGSGWTGLLSLDIVAFDSSLGSAQVSSGSIVLTSPPINPSVVPEPSSLLLAGLGLVVVAGRFGTVVVRSRK